MRSLPLFLGVILTVLLSLFQEALAQQGQTVRIVEGNKVTLRADASHALSFIWFKDNEPLNGFHDQRIVVTEPGTYTVIALGDGCNSDVSDPVVIILGSPGEDVVVDVEIRNLPDRLTVTLGQEFNYQLLVLNNGSAEATEMVITFDIPQHLQYLRPTGSYMGTVYYTEATHQLIWKVPALAVQESMSLWVAVRGVADGEAITMAKVSSKELDIDMANNFSESKVNIVFFQIPNVFTPNGDNVNDTFEIKGLKLFSKRKLRVFDRFGFEVYVSNDYNGDWTGEGLNEGTYFYILEVSKDQLKPRVIKGYVTILR